MFGLKDEAKPLKFGAEMFVWLISYRHNAEKKLSVRVKIVVCLRESDASYFEVL